MAEAQVDLDKTFVRAGVDGRVEQFLVRVGDVVNPLMRPAGVLIPEGAGRRSLQAGFGQIEAQVMKPGMVAEATCVSKPWVIIPLVVTSRGAFRAVRPNWTRQRNSRLVAMPWRRRIAAAATPGFSPARSLASARQ